jgi:hypothetical protein
MNDLKSGVQKGQVALGVLTGTTYFLISKYGQLRMRLGSGTCRRCRLAL